MGHGIQPCAVCFGLTLAFAMLGPEAGARLDVTAVFCSPFSLRNVATENAAHPAALSTHPSVVAGERQTQTSPHCGSTEKSKGLWPLHEPSFQSRGRVHVSALKSLPQIAPRAATRLNNRLPHSA